MPPGIPVATVAINGALNAGILCAQMITTGDSNIFTKTVEYKEFKKEDWQANQIYNKKNSNLEPINLNLL